MGEAQFGLGENKKILVEPWVGGKGSIVKLYSCFLAGARGLTVYLFFLG
jgi:hypothetical protein